jgi:hypothetical protein
MRWLALLAPGDWLVCLVAAVLCAMSYPFFWQGGAGEKALVRRAGRVVAELDLSRPRSIDVEGAIGVTTIAVDRHRVRVVADPGLHQYCVRQGWLARAGEIAICAPNQISVQIVGGKEPYDSLSY